MFDVNVCYKIIFQSLFEENALEHIATAVHDYTQASVALILLSGDVIACAGNRWNEMDFGNERHLTLGEYDRFHTQAEKLGEYFYKESDTSYILVGEFMKQGRLAGYSLLHFRDESQEEMLQKVNEMISQATEIFLETCNLEIYENIPMRKRLCAYTIFEGNKEAVGRLEPEVPKEYMLGTFFCLENQEKQKLAQELQGIWNDCYFYFEQGSVDVVFYGLNDKVEENIIQKLEKLHVNCCVSERFSELIFCANKADLLKRIERLGRAEEKTGVLRERDWYSRVIYTYTLPIMREAGVCDYCVELLLEEDELRNTNLYETLKMYLLCENNMSDTAARLHIHRNTLVYRLKQIQGLVDRDINDYKTARELLAYMMMYDISRQIEED